MYNAEITSFTDTNPSAERVFGRAKSSSSISNPFGHQGTVCVSLSRKRVWQAIDRDDFFIAGGIITLG